MFAYVWHRFRHHDVSILIFGRTGVGRFLWLLPPQEGLDDTHAAPAARAWMLWCFWLFRLSGCRSLGVGGLDGIDWDDWILEQFANARDIFSASLAGEETVIADAVETRR